MRLAISVLLLVSTGAAAQRREEVPALESARAALRKADLAFCAALVARDKERFLSFIWEDATFYGSSAPVQGKEQIFERWAPHFAPDGNSTVRWEPYDVVVALSGDLGYTRGEAVFTRTDEQGQITTARSHYVTIWKRDPAGSWKAVVDIGTPPQQHE